MTHPELSYAATVIFGTVLAVAFLVGLVAMIWHVSKEARK